MGRLYDRQDLAFNLNFWNQQEQRLSVEVASGLLPASALNSVVSYSSPNRVMGDNGRYLNDDVRPTRHLRLKDAFEYERQKERFKLLRTGHLLSNLRAWQDIFKACPHCHQEVHQKGRFKGRTRDVPCDDHEKGYKKAKSDVWWAGQHNVEEREARGQHRADNIATTQEVLEAPAEAHEGGLNKLESLYSRDKADGQWLVADAKRYDVEFSYKGWLEARLEDEEITEQEYLEECQRLREQAEHLETLKAPTDREKPWLMPKQPSRKEMGFRRDTRFTHLVN